VIKARALSRTFKSRSGPVEAVRGVDLEVAAGEIVGFLGPNGAGKTTTLRMLTTLLKPTSGEATVAGRDLRRDPEGVRRRIGYVPQSGSTLPEALAGEEIVDQARLYGLSIAEARRRGEVLFDRLDLEGLWKRTCKSLSGGQRRRLDIAMGLIHDPKLVFLDEPTTGLDPQSRANLWEHVRALRQDQGATIFLTTHYLDEADALCDRILVIDHGAIVAAGSPEELKRRVSGDAVTITLVDAAQATIAAKVLGGLPSADEPVIGAREGAGQTVTVHVAHGGSALPGLLRELDARAIELDGVEVRRPSLDDVFLSLTGRSLRDTPGAA
jgi:ABC-2 type transport system ATP-binding protein